MNLEASHRLAHDLADAADAITLPAFRERLETGGVDVESKSDGSPVTAVDEEVESALRRLLRERAPDTAVLGEEGGLDGPDDAPTWVIDPIDGTNNFILGIPVFATLIALAIDDEPILGVVSAPAMGTRWDALRGGAARQDGRDLRVSRVDRLEDAHVCFGGLNYFHDRYDGLGPVETLAARTHRQRGFGDFWQHCLVAAGAVDIAIEMEVNRWDLAAPKVIVEAAGGRFTDLDGIATDTGGDAVATNGLLHDEVLDLLRRTD